MHIENCQLKIAETFQSRQNPVAGQECPAYQTLSFNLQSIIRNPESDQVPSENSPVGRKERTITRSSIVIPSAPFGMR